MTGNESKYDVALGFYQKCKAVEILGVLEGKLPSPIVLSLCVAFPLSRRTSGFTPCCPAPTPPWN